VGSPDFRIPRYLIKVVMSFRAKTIVSTLELAGKVGLSLRG
jgi:hypothetical protein